MYTKRIKLTNYGPIGKLDIEFPFNGEIPMPVVLVGENGSGKSIVLSHIVNGLIIAKDFAFPETPEVETGKVYKLRSSIYIKQNSEYYFSKVDFEGGFFVSELRTRLNKEDYSAIPPEITDTEVQDAWHQMDGKANDSLSTGINAGVTTKNKLDDLFNRNCVLYFPFNRYEEPAWLNEESLKATARYMNLRHLVGQTSRKVISHSPLHDNQNWLFGVIYDRAAFEIQTSNFSLPGGDGKTAFPLPIFSGYSGQATNTYDTALQIVRTVTRKVDARFGIGPRNNRVVSIESTSGQLVPNVFQLSSGETSLLNLFLSILRDFDLCGSSFSNAADIRGIVVVDEIDLHLHTIHQYEVLPRLIEMFPKVQFIVTTHSPLFALGMQQAFGENGFALYRLPVGHRISPEEFSEFGDAYQAFVATHTFNKDIQAAIENSLKPIVFVEGTTDQRYIEKASRLLGKEMCLESLEIRDGGGSGKLAKMWKDSVLPLTAAFPHQVLLLFDCDTSKQAANKGKLFQRCIPMQDHNPVKRGIENLFNKSTLEMARQHNPAFFITEEEHGGTDENGNPVTIPESWKVNDSEKVNLCDWLCENGTEEDFKSFSLIFDLMEEALGLTDPVSTVGETEAAT